MHHGTMAVLGRSPLFLAALTAAAALGLGATLALGRSSSAATSSAVRARITAMQFFDALNGRRYDRACDLLSGDFYRLNGVPDRAHCVLGLRVGMSLGDLRYRITGVSASNGRATVHAVANGAPGRLVLVEEGGRYKVLALESG